MKLDAAEKNGYTTQRAILIRVVIRSEDEEKQPEETSNENSEPSAARHLQRIHI
jgi:hypothetical protein